MIEGRVTWNLTFFPLYVLVTGVLRDKKNFGEQVNSLAFTKYGHLSKPGDQNSYLNWAELSRI